jgi:hypothetical protein
VCVCVCERESWRERERESVCVRACVFVCVSSMSCYRAVKWESETACQETHYRIRSREDGKSAK